MKTVRLGIIGLGQMGRTHARQVLAGSVPRLRLTAVADQHAPRLTEFAPAAAFTDPQALIDSGRVDAVLIATPHYSHVELGCAALRAGLHLLVEKPVAAQTSAARRLLAAARRRPRQVSAVMFNQRTDLAYRRIRMLLQQGDLGTIRRIQWTVTNWFRPAAYYRSSPWRATWAGEGGGVLLNQCVHNLDLFQWLFGRPRLVRAHCAFGRYHDIEVEDDVTAFFEYRGGAHATFITSTGEAPGTNRLEIVAEGGQIIFEPNTVLLRRNAVPMSAFSRTTPELFAAPAFTTRKWSGLGAGGQHREILRNFTAAILRREPLIAPLAEGLVSLELANAILLSAWTGGPVTLPVNAARYDRLLAGKIARARRQA